MTKEEKIKEAWGEYYEKIKDELDEHGRYSYADQNLTERRRKLWQFENIECYQNYELELLLPSNIKGIENNNGWVKTHEIVLPVTVIDCHFVVNKKVLTGHYNPLTRYFEDRNKRYSIEFVTHYQPIKEPKPPIY